MMAFPQITTGRLTRTEIPDEGQAYLDRLKMKAEDLMARNDVIHHDDMTLWGRRR